MGLSLGGGTRSREVAGSGRVGARASSCRGAIRGAMRGVNDCALEVRVATLPKRGPLERECRLAGGAGRVGRLLLAAVPLGEWDCSKTRHTATIPINTHPTKVRKPIEASIAMTSAEKVSVAYHSPVQAGVAPPTGIISTDGLPIRRRRP